MGIGRTTSRKLLLFFALGLMAFLAVSVASSLRERASHFPSFDVGGTADVRVKAFSFVQTDGTTSGLILKATQAELYEKNQKAILENITATIPYGEGHSFQIEGDRGEIDSEKKDFSLRNKSGLITIALENDYIVQTSELRWDEAQRTLFSQGPVHISGLQAEIDGDAFKIFVDDQEMVIIGDVKARVQ